MLSFFPGILVCFISITLTILNTAYNSLLIVTFSLLKLMVPVPPFGRWMSHLANLFMQNWLQAMR